MVAPDSTNKPAAVVIGLDSVTGLQTARLLASRGIPVVAIARNPQHSCCRTNTCEQIVVANTGDEELVATLERLGPTFTEPPVLFPCTDLSVLMVSRYRDTLGARYRAVLPAPAVVELLLDKARFHAYAMEAQLPVAATYVIKHRADAQMAARDLRFPCVLKPAVKTASWQRQTTAKLYKATNGAELLQLYDRCRDWTDALVAQEWIEGPDNRHFTCNAYFDAQSRPLVTFVSQKLRQWPPEGGVGCLSQECRNDTVVQETIRVFQGVGHRGLAYLEMKLDSRTDRHLIVEPNVGRPTGRSAGAEAAGVDLLYTQYCDALGWPLPPNREERYQGAKWIYLRQDCQSAFYHWRRGTLGVAEWARSLRGCRVDAVFSWKDPRPFFADLANAYAKTAARRRERRERPAASPVIQNEHNRHAAGTPRIGAPPADTVDYDIHGLVGLRLVGPSPSDAAAVERQLGPLQGPLCREPDIVVRFVDELPIDGLRWIEFGRTGFTDDGFFVLQSGKRAARVKVAFDQIGGRCEIVCQRGLRSIPFLVAIVNVTVLKRDCVPLHASAFVYEGTGVVVTGWAKGGKTEALLAFAARGAEYVGDEWILLSGDGRRMFGIPEFIRLQDWHLDSLPSIRRWVPAERRLLFRIIRLLDRLHRTLPDVARPFPLKLLNDALPALRRQLNIQLDPSKVFGRGPRSFVASPQKIFFMVSHEHPAIRVEPADPQDIARRMAASISYEQLPLSAPYLAYQFAFPGRRSELLDSAHAVQSRLLTRAFAGKEAYMVRHPYPCELHELFDAMAPACKASAGLVYGTNDDHYAKGAINVEATRA